LIRIVINTAMQAERQKYLRAAPFEHALDCQGVSNSDISTENNGLKSPLKIA
jgi:hypothetical protein